MFLNINGLAANVCNSIWFVFGLFCGCVCVFRTLGAHFSRKRRKPEAARMNQNKKKKLCMKYDGNKFNTAPIKKRK